MLYSGIIKKNIAAFSILFLIFLMYSLEREDLQELIVQNMNYGLDFQLTYKTGKTTIKRSSLTKIEKESSNCDIPVKLQNIADLSSIEYGVFMMETSGFHPLILMIKISIHCIDKGRGKLGSRQACAVESAAKRSGLPVHVIIFSPVLHLRDNTTCELYKSKYPIKFYTIDVETFTINTPLGLNFSNFWLQYRVTFQKHSSHLQNSSQVHTRQFIKLMP